MVIYTVKSGDSLYAIARRFGSDVATIARDNELREPYALTVGETLVIPKPKSVYRVQAGDNLYSVAARFGITVNELWRNNPFLGGKTELREGEVLTIVPEAPIYDREVAVNAYVYPSIDRDVLRKTLPYLTYMTVFTYGIEDDGTLIEMDDEEIVELARQYGTAPILLVSALGSDGKFSSDLAVRVLGNENARNTLIEEIATALGRKRYSGVDMDFEYIPAEYAEEYASFLGALRERLEPSGYRVFVSLAPKTSAQQEGLLYEGHDYKELGAAADRAFLMTYEWGYRYGPPMAVSPVDKVRDVVDYAVSAISAEKLLLGVPNYGYDWKLPYVSGESQAVSLGNTEAVNLAREKKVAIEYDEESAAPFFRYFDRVNGKVQEHVVWFEDAKSIEALLGLVEEYGLYGIGVWNGMRYFPALWQVLNHTFPILKVLG